jgi:hypothetical protein
MQRVESRRTKVSVMLRFSNHDPTIHTPRKITPALNNNDQFIERGSHPVCVQEGFSPPTRGFEGCLDADRGAE